MTEVSIIMGARGRLHHTRRTLQSYTKLSYKDYELLFMNIKHDGDDLDCLYDEFKDKLPIRFINLQEDFDVLTPESTWTPATTWNKGIAQSVGKFTIVCSADILLSYPDMIEKFLVQYQNERESVLTYFLTAPQTKELDNEWVDWMNDPLAIQYLSGFWDTEINGQTNRERGSAGLTTFITGQPRDAWEYIGKFRTELSHLVNDQDLHMRERALGKGCATLQEYCGYHQCHPPQKAVTPKCSPGWHYTNEMQARLLEPAERDAT